MIILCYTLLELYLLFVFFLATMNLYRAYLFKRISTPALILGYPILYVALMLDVIGNILVCLFIFFRKPKHFLLTTTLSHYMKTDTGWRGKFSIWICHNLLDAFDLTHIKRCK